MDKLYPVGDGLLSLRGANASLPPITLMHVGARWYDPGIGRFVQRDPIGLGGGVNVYAYCQANPLMRIDPHGLYDVVEDVVVDVKNKRILVHVYHIPTSLRERLTWDGPRYITTKVYNLQTPDNSGNNLDEDALRAAGAHATACVKGLTEAEEKLEEGTKENLIHWGGHVLGGIGHGAGKAGGYIP
jgi:RHS repeat-associated protein